MKSELLLTNELALAAKVLRAMNHKLRRNILYLLEKREKMTVSEIYAEMKLEQSVCSFHLAILSKAGVVGSERVGKHRCYYLNYPRIRDINVFAQFLAATRSI